MKIIYNNLIPFKGFAAINLFGFLFVRKGIILSSRAIDHEKIHTVQMREMLYLPFYLAYILEWFLKLFIYGLKSYNNISFEREAYRNQHDADYLKSRKPFSWIKYIKK